MKSALRHILYKIAPDSMRLRSAKKRREINRKLFGARQTESRRILFGNQEIKIISGPFSGMKYIDEITWGPIEPKWLGTYEFELHSTLHKIISNNYINIIDIGSAEGFYSVGLAWKCPKTSVVAFDVDPISREQQKILASLNNVENLDICKFCSSGELQTLILDRTLVICDIEGSEVDLLNLHLTPNLHKADILVELHNVHGKSIEDVENELSSRFLKTHLVSIIDFSSDVINRKLSLTSANLDIDDSLLDEFRDMNGQKWLWMQHR